MINNSMSIQQAGALAPPPTVGTISAQWINPAIEYNTNVIRITTSGSAWPAGKPSNGLIYEVYFNSNFCSVSAANMTETIVNVPVSSTGTWNVTLKAVDAAGQKSASSNSQPVSVYDITGPDFCIKCWSFGGGTLNIWTEAYEYESTVDGQFVYPIGFPGNIGLGPQSQSGDGVKQFTYTYSQTFLCFYTHASASNPYGFSTDGGRWLY